MEVESTASVEGMAWAVGIGIPLLVATNYLTAWLFCWLLDNRMESVEKKILAAINKEGKPALLDAAAKRREKNRAKRKRRKERQRAKRQFDPRSQLGARNGDP